MHVAASAVAELTSKVFGRENDLMHIKEKMVLAGAYARGLIKTRVALENAAQGEMTGIMEAHLKEPASMWIVGKLSKTVRLAMPFPSYW